MPENPYPQQDGKQPALRQIRRKALFDFDVGTHAETTVALACNVVVMPGTGVRFRVPTIGAKASEQLLVK